MSGVVAAAEIISAVIPLVQDLIKLIEEHQAVHGPADVSEPLPQKIQAKILQAFSQQSVVGL